MASTSNNFQGGHIPIGVTLSTASTTAIVNQSEFDSSSVFTHDDSIGSRVSAAPSPTIISAMSMPAIISLRQDWIGTRMGLLVLFQGLFGIVAIVCAATPGSYHPPYRSFFLAVACVVLIITVIWFLIHLANVNNVFYNVPWITIDLILNIFCQFCYTVAFIVILVLAGRLENHVAAGVFGAFLSILYGIGAFLAFVRLRSGDRSAT